MNKAWKKLKVSRAELQLGPTLGGGQSFRWKNVNTDSWIGVFRNKVWILLQTDDELLYKTYDSEISDNSTEQNENFQILSDKETENILRSYFRLDVNLCDYYKHWSEVDSYFREAAPKMFGIRILKQDVVENVFSFICSSNNNIKRISSMVEKLCELYGDVIAKVQNETFRSFPTTEKLAGNSVESDLRNAGFGYRAKFIYQTACLINKLGGSVWFENLKSLQYQDAKKELMKLPGVGAKVADCICLMSLGHMEAIPVDTHIFQVATNIYLPHLKKYKSLTDKVYNLIGDHFRLLHGSYAGWANTEIQRANLYLYKEKLKKWDNEEIGLDKRWVEIFRHFRVEHNPHKILKVLVEISLCCPGTNAAVERGFSLGNDYWSSDKAQFSVKTLLSVLTVKFNMQNESCSDVATLDEHPHSEKEIHSEEKYVFKRK